jgi:hypothetical protein
LALNLNDAIWSLDWESVKRFLDQHDSHLIKSCCSPDTKKSQFWIGGKWHDADCSQLNKQPTNMGEYLDLTNPNWNKYTLGPDTKPKCECGAYKVYGPGNQMHSAIMPCPLYKKY